MALVAGKMAGKEAREACAGGGAIVDAGAGQDADAADGAKDAGVVAVETTDAPDAATDAAAGRIHAANACSRAPGASWRNERGLDSQ